MAIVTSLPVWATCVATVGGAWTTGTMMQQVPLYASRVLGYELKTVNKKENIDNPRIKQKFQLNFYQ